jgi:hypothetical protein
MQMWNGAFARPQCWRLSVTDAAFKEDEQLPWPGDARLPPEGPPHNN